MVFLEDICVIIAIHQFKEEIKMADSKALLKVDMKVEQLLKKIREIDLINETSQPIVGSALLKSGSKYRVQVCITLHDYLDESYRWRKSVSIEEVVEKKARDKQRDIEDAAKAVIEECFIKRSHHDMVEAIENWADEQKTKTSLSISTRDSRVDASKIIIRYFSFKPMTVEEVTTTDINNFTEWALDYGRVKPKFNEISKKMDDYSLARRTVKDYHGVLYNFFEAMILKKYISDNPCKGSKIPKRNEVAKTKIDVPWFEIDTYKKYMNWLINDCNKYDRQHLKKLIPIVELAVATGMRREEICGLRWNRVDFVNNTVSVTRTRVRTSTGVYDKNGAKTESSIREYKLDSDLLSSLSRVKDNQKKLGIYKEDGFVFVWEESKQSPIGTEYNPDYLSKLFKKSVKECEYANSEMHFHHLRHSACSILFSKGWTLDKVQAWLGHEEGSKITMEVYNHYKVKISDNDKKEFFEAIRI